MYKFIVVLFLLLPEFGPFLSDKMTKETDQVFLAYPMLFERVMKNWFSSHRI